jgi:hypothetical protein
MRRTTWRAISARPYPAAQPDFTVVAIEGVPLTIQLPGQGLTLVHFSARPQPFWSVSRFVSNL